MKPWVTSCSCGQGCKNMPACVYEWRCGDRFLGVDSCRGRRWLGVWPVASGPVGRRARTHKQTWVVAARRQVARMASGPAAHPRPGEFTESGSGIH